MQWLSGVVERGDGRGRALGFATANLSVQDLPADLQDGVWAAWCRVGSDTTVRQGALHVGPRPTFDDEIRRVEVHILDFEDRDLYGEELAFQPVRWLRGVEKFSSVEDLVAAIAHDCRQVEEFLSGI